jgi:outer membrane protein assembly factor BamB
VWSSPTIVDDVLVIGDCSGRVRAFDVAQTAMPPTELWQVPTGKCIEASAAVWDGTVYIGSRDGYLYALRDVP